MIAVRPVRPRAPVAVANGDVTGALDNAAGADETGPTTAGLLVPVADTEAEIVGLAGGFAAGGVDLCEPCVTTTATTATAAAAPTAVAATIGFEICRAFATFVAVFVSL